MSDDALVSLAAPARESNPPGELLRSGGRRAIEAAVSAEFEPYLSGFVRVKRPDGVKGQRVVRNGEPSDPLIVWLKLERARVPTAKREPTLAEHHDVSDAARDQGGKWRIAVGGHRLDPLPALARANDRTHPYLAQLAANGAENPPNPEQLPDNRPAHRRPRTRRQCTSMGSSERSVQADVFHTGPVERFESSLGQESSGPDASPDRTVPSSAGLAVEELFEDADVVPVPHRLIPAREIPSMNVFWANRKANSSGALIITAAAMRPP